MVTQMKVSIFVGIALAVIYKLNFGQEKIFDHENLEKVIIKEGYPIETHYVLTEDEYILTVHRIPGAPHSIPVYLQHGHTSSSADWLKNGKNRSLAYILSDHGYDVWIGNRRGNTYSKKHKKYHSSDPKFWDFSWHEIGFYDVSATITYISGMTNNTLFYVGHSMGCSTFAVMASERPEIAKKVRAMVALAPAVYQYHIEQSLFRESAKFWEKFESITNSLGIYEIFSQGMFFKFLTSWVFEIPYFGSMLGSNLLFYLFGYSPDQLDHMKLSIYMDGSPAGTSVKTHCHWMQQMVHNSFRRYDYGTEKNLELYNSAEPPAYDLTRIHVPIAVFYSDNDIVTTSADVLHFYKQVPLKLGSFNVGHSFNHMDFLWGINATELVYDKIIDLLETAYASNQSSPSDKVQVNTSDLKKRMKLGV